MNLVMIMNSNDSFDQYLVQFEPLIQTRLTKVYTIFQKAFPEAKFFLSYQMPTFKGKKNLVHFAAYTNHIGIYPGPLGIQVLLDAFPTIKLSKGTWLIPHQHPFPVKEFNVLCAWIQSQNLE
jgi:uncharacterized protein YdhG (YjbR/CyaY superfamily)